MSRGGHRDGSEPRSGRTLACFRAFFSPGPVEKERLFASLSLYLLFGLIFALIFAVIEELLPGSFYFPDPI